MPVGPLPTEIKPMSQVSEQLIVHQLLSELNALHCMKLSEKPELKLSRLIFVGASHAGKMATLLGSSDQVLYLSLPSQTAPKGHRGRHSQQT